MSSLSDYLPLILTILYKPQLQDGVLLENHKSDWFSHDFLSLIDNDCECTALETEYHS